MIEYRTLLRVQFAHKPGYIAFLEDMTQVVRAGYDVFQNDESMVVAVDGKAWEEYPEIADIAYHLGGQVQYH